MNELNEPYRLRWYHGALLILIGLALWVIPIAVSAQCPNLGEAFYLTDCLNGDQPQYEECCNWCMEYYQVFEFTVPQNATSTVFMVDDSEVVWSHAPSDLYVDFIIFQECNEQVLYSSYNGWCDESIDVLQPSASVRNDAYTVELNLPSGVYYLAIPIQGATGSSTMSGCFGITVFSPTVLVMGVQVYWFDRKRNLPRYDLSGRRY